MSLDSEEVATARNSRGHCFRLLLIASSSLVLSACFSLTQREIQRDVADSPTLVTINAFTFDSILGLKLIRSNSYRGGVNRLSSERFVDVETFKVENISVTIDAPIEAREPITASFRSSEKNAIGSEGESSKELKRAIGIYARFHDSVDPLERLPTIRLRIIPYNYYYSTSNFFVSSDITQLEMTIVVSPPATGSDAERMWAAQVVSLIAHELSHSRSLSRRSLFPNAISDETIAHLIEYQIRWEIEGNDLPADIVNVPGDGNFQRRMLELTLPEIAQKVSVLHPSNAGSVLAQAIIWKNLGVNAVPKSDKAKFDALRDLCITYSRHPPDFTLS